MPHTDRTILKAGFQRRESNGPLNFFSENGPHTGPHPTRLAALFLSVAVAYWIGKFKIGNFSFGGMAGTLPIAVVIGPLGVPVDPVITDMMFALFIYASGYVGGPQFFASRVAPRLMGIEK